MQDSDAKWGNLEGRVDIFCAFDFSSGRFRFDRSEPARLRDRNTLVDAKIEGPAGSWRAVEQRNQFIQTKKARTFFKAGEKAVSVEPLTSTRTSEASPFDIRCLGMGLFIDLLQFCPYEELEAAYAKDIPESIVQEDKDLTRVTWRTKSHEITMWVSEAKGFSPCRLELREKKKTKGTGKSGWILAETSEVSWQEVSNTWVPKTFRVQVFASSRPRMYELALEWESVNAVVSAGPA
jgi:hypothetical protein